MEVKDENSDVIRDREFERAEIDCQAEADFKDLKIRVETNQVEIESST